VHINPLCMLDQLVAKLTLVVRNGGYARPGADWALVTECHAVLGQLALTLVGLLSVTGVIGKVIVA
jgi:hypothetical protein